MLEMMRIESGVSCLRNLLNREFYRKADFKEGMAKGDKSLLLSHGLLEPHITTTRRGQPSYVRYNVIVRVEFMEKIINHYRPEF